MSRSLAAAVVGAVLFSVLGSDSAQASTQVLAFAKSVSEVFDHIRDWLTGILAGLATVFLTIGGVRYLMASGDPGEVEKAKQSFKSAGWGFGLAALAPLVVEILRGIVGA
ncbi:pilin [Amycolatopsis jejuensis]|uniref:pilin n=1 Tax=Amycolatopsis jejuensis TaxID=330084 RepID=UPI000689F973|nr:pilin [Amycolatopsis jejuensis]